jgi:ribosome-binding factor A
LEAVRNEGWRVRKSLAEAIGKQVRIIPELNFYLDDSLDYYEAVNKALND